MIRIVFIALAFLSPFFFPLAVSALIAFAAAFASAWVPLVVGLMLDTLYYQTGAYAYPLYSLIGALGSLVALGVHRFVETSIMRG